jgi:hypothetical protein
MSRATSPKIGFGCNFLGSAETGFVKYGRILSWTRGRPKMLGSTGLRWVTVEIWADKNFAKIGVVKVVSGHRICVVEIEVGNVR